MTSASDNIPLSYEMVRNIVLTWYRSTNEHRPVAAFETLLSEDVVMHYPNKAEPVVGRQAFRDWYADVLKLYFDEIHLVESWDIQVEGQWACATVVVRWEARSWLVGESRSKYEAHLSRQRFELKRSPGDGSVVISHKIVETFEATAPVYGVGQ